MSEKPDFRPDLEGLRALAVLLVLLYHARILSVAGGYVGVDVFFVLSGFLITGLIARELRDTGRVNLPAFYARRARRLLPAAAFVLIVTVAASALILPPLRMPLVAGDTVSAALYVSNIRFALQATDYLGSQLPPSPVLHYWSLSVEEQFYVFWPTLLALAAGATFLRGRTRTGTRRLALTLLGVMAGSFALSVWLTEVDQPWAFFSLPTRAWELALGGLLALPGAARFVPARATAAIGWIGVALIVLAGLTFGESVTFPGLAALIPTVGSALVIAAGLPAGVLAGSRYRVDRVLALAPVRYLGRISYSLYLWHWPMLVLPAVAAGGTLPGPVRLGFAGLAILAAAATQRWIEDPIRHGRFVGLRPRRSLVLAGLLSALVVATTASLGLAVGPPRSAGPAVGGGLTDVALPPDQTPAADPSDGVPGGSQRPAASSPVPSLPPLAPVPVPVDLVPPLAQALDDLPVVYSDGCHLDFRGVAPGDCVFGVPGSSVTVVLLGDSHAAQWFPALERLATEHGWRLISMTKSACAPADLPVWNSIVDRTYDECAQWREAAIERIAAEHPDLVVVSSSDGYQAMVDGRPIPIAEVPALWDAALGRTLQRLAGLARHVVVIGDTPRALADPPDCLSANLGDATACALPYAKAVNSAWTADEAAVAAGANAWFVDPTQWICRTDPCPVVIGRILVFRDQHHLTATYARALAERLYGLLPPLGP